MNAVDAVVDALAAYRIVHFVVDDSLIDGQRDRARQWLLAHGHTKLVEGLGCYWCVSPYVAAGVVAARKVMPVSWSIVARALAISAVVGVADLAVTRLAVRHG